MLPLFTDFDIIEVLDDTRHVIFCRAVRKEDKKPVLLKILKPENATIQDIAQFDHEYTIMRSLVTEHVCKVIGKEQLTNSEIIILEECEGQLLSELIKARKIDLAAFLLIAFSLAQALEDVHRHKIMVKNLRPQNILVNPVTKLVSIIDFSESSKLVAELPPTFDIIKDINTIPYLSPEQLGWTKRLVDYRTDIFTLGVVLYEMLTMSFPYEAGGIKQLISSQVKSTPISPHKIDDNHPEAISHIILKCLEKQPEDRYQSATGIARDLEDCIKQLNTQGFIESFPLAKYDRRDAYGRVWVSQKLYGRDEEEAILKKGFHEALSGSSSAIFITGENGIGKTKLAESISKEVLQKDGFFVSHSCKEHEVNIPYSPFATILPSLVKQLTNDQGILLDEWKERLKKGIGLAESVLIDLIPFFEEIFEKKEPIIIDDLAKKEKAIYFLIDNFLEIFARKEHPLTIFIDNLHWADYTSLCLLKFIIEEKKQHLFVLGTWNEEYCDKKQAHLLNDLIAAKKDKIATKQIKLQRIEVQDVHKWFVDTISCTHESINVYAEEIYKKINGNLLFGTYLLEQLNDEGLLKYNASGRYWELSAATEKLLNELTSLDQIISYRLRKASPQALFLLSAFALIVDPHALTILAIINQRSAKKTFNALLEALNTRLIVTTPLPYVFPERTTIEDFSHLKNILAFAHDEVGQAIKKAITPHEVLKLEFEIGRTFADVYHENREDRTIFAVASRLNATLANDTERKDDRLILELNEKAAKRAISIAAFDEGTLYAAKGLETLSVNKSLPESESHAIEYSLCNSLFTGLIALRRYEEGEKAFDKALSLTKSKAEKSRLYLHKVMAYLCANDHKTAYQTGLNAIEALEINLGSNTSFGIAFEKIKINAQLLLQGKDTLEKKDFETDPEKIVIAQLYHVMMPLPLILEGTLITTLLLQSMRNILQSGLTEYSGATLVLFAAFLTSEKQQHYRQGKEVAEVGLRIAAKFPLSSVTVGVETLDAMFTSTWNNSLSYCIDKLRQRERNCLELGNPFLSSEGLLFLSFFMLIKGDSLEQVLNECERTVEKIISNRNRKVLGQLLAIIGACHILMGQNNDPFDLIPDSLRLKYDLEELSDDDLCKKCCRIFVLYYTENYEAVVSLAKNIPEDRTTIGGPMWRTYHYYYALALASLCRDQENKKKYWELLLKQYERIKLWSKDQSPSQKHQYILISAIIAELSGSSDQAFELYEYAIREAEENEYFHEEAIALEWAARLYEKLEKKRLSSFYFHEAHYAFSRWGGGFKT